jgi:hypothetical protein
MPSSFADVNQSRIVASDRSNHSGSISNTARSMTPWGKRLAGTDARDHGSRKRLQFNQDAGDQSVTHQMASADAVHNQLHAHTFPETELTMYDVDKDGHAYKAYADKQQMNARVSVLNSKPSFLPKQDSYPSDGYQLMKIRTLPVLDNLVGPLLQFMWGVRGLMGNVIIRQGRF